jgi:hypothetical protein
VAEDVVGWYDDAMSITWPCRLSVASYAALGRSAPAPRPDCTGCSRPMAYDGRYPRLVRERAVVHRIFVRRVQCRRCGERHALLPDFVLLRRRDSAQAVGAAVLGALDVKLPERATELFSGVSERTVRSWRQRFAARAEELRQRLDAVALTWRGELDFPVRDGPTASHRAVEAMGRAWRAAKRRPLADVPAPWQLANVIIGSQLIYTRVDLPWPIRPSTIGRSRAP